MIEAGAAGVHFEDQLASEKKCGHLGGKVLVPTAQFVRTLNAARLAADVCGVPDGPRRAHRRARRQAADERRRRADEASSPASARPKASSASTTASEPAIARGLAYAPYADLSGARPRRPTSARPASSPRRSTTSSPASCWRTTARPRSTGRRTSTTRRSRRSSSELAAMGYRFQFVTLAGFHSLNLGMFELARGYARARHAGVRRAAGARVRAGGGRATPRRATSARSAPATSTWWPRRSARGRPPRSR